MCTGPSNLLTTSVKVLVLTSGCDFIWMVGNFGSPFGMMSFNFWSNTFFSLSITSSKTSKTASTLFRPASSRISLARAGFREWSDSDLINASNERSMSNFSLFVSRQRFSRLAAWLPCRRGCWDGGSESTSALRWVNASNQDQPSHLACKVRVELIKPNLMATKRLGQPWQNCDDNNTEYNRAEYWAHRLYDFDLVSENLFWLR